MRRSPESNETLHLWGSDCYDDAVRLFLAVLVGCSQPSQPAPGPVPAPSAPAPAAVPDAPVVPDAPPVAPDAAAVARPPIVDTPMAWSDRREALTLEYRRRHSDPDAVDLAIVPKVIVLHYTGGDSAKSTRSYFDNVTIEDARKELQRAGKVNVSAHFVVDRDGTIYQLQPVTRFARHCIGLNHVAIGIENAGDEAKFPLTDAQVLADAALVRWLVAENPTITHLLGHHEVMGFRADPLYVERDASYKNDKPDPGARFMAKVRAKLGDLDLKGP